MNSKPDDPQFYLLRTSELSLEQKQDFQRIFEETFKKEKSIESFEHQFRSPEGHDSYHAFAMQNGKMVAIYTFLPCRYIVRGEPMLFVLGCDSIVTKEASLGIGGLLKMFKMAEKEMLKDGVRFFFGFPNDNYYEYVKNILKLKEIGILDFYVLPLNPGGILRNLRIFDPICRFFTISFARTMASFSSSKKLHFEVEKINDDSFLRQRYDSRHHFLKLPDGSTIVYMIYQEERMKVAYIVDIGSLSRKNFFLAMALTGKAVKDQAAMVAYPCGRLPYRTFLRIPRRFLPRELHFMGRCISKETEEKFPELLCLKDWNVNLSNFDVR